MTCQAKFDGCDNRYVTWHHYPKRSTAFYKKRPHLLESDKHKIAVCQMCHHQLDVTNRKLNEKLFPAETIEIARKWKMGIAPE